MALDDLIRACNMCDSGKLGLASSGSASRTDTGDEDIHSSKAAGVQYNSSGRI